MTDSRFAKSLLLFFLESIFILRVLGVVYWAQKKKTGSPNDDPIPDAMMADTSVSTLSSCCGVSFLSFSPSSRTFSGCAVSISKNSCGETPRYSQI